MGWLEGVLTGYADRHYEIQKQKREDAALAAEREAQVYKTLLDSPYKETRDLAAAGILGLGKSPRRSGGIAGWMGEIEQSPYLDMIRRTQDRIGSDRPYALEQLGRTDDAQRPVPPTPSIPETAGSVPPPAPGSPPGALPETSLVTGGPAPPVTPAPTGPGGPPAPPTPTTPVGPAGFTPGPMAAVGGPPVENAMTSERIAGPPRQPPQPSQPLQFAAQGPPPAPPQPPQPPTAGMPGGNNGSVGRQPPVPSARTSLAPLPGIFPSTADRQRAAARALVGGKLDEYVAMYQAQGFDEPTAYAKAAELLERDVIGSSGIGQSYAEGNVEADPSSPTGFSQILYLRSDPKVQRRIPAQPPNTPEYLAEKRAAVADVNATAPLSRQGQLGATLSLRDDWRMVSSKLMAQLSSINQIKAAYAGAVTRGDLGANAEALIVMWEKSLDALSVVRESEAARPGQFSSLINRVEGLWDRLTKGGATITIDELKGYVTTAEELGRAAAPLVEAERQRIEGMARRYGIEPRDIVPAITPGYVAPPTTNPSPANAAAAANSTTSTTTTSTTTGAPADGTISIDSTMERGPDGRYRLKKP